ncbi:hypothetical protein PUNSTDRAFT_145276 [Punctularia strigosozonata HHB-11173 SS5]|uniref:uncharacterized protein n=1 Tax=Punctularia strigosozonata (strain HHB-11173) TaxID=741275 RepID=UPI00044168F2|nr:uncharacterized protein PUNSTDRAFT_145276 [Punctularia strigosozonata HHB-11173 SS5]EIN06788.1 hypothetical protein PUNSTDRAFT_145276 [Punctularia strigosozonata HHB-11173 SS5]
MSPTDTPIVDLNPTIGPIFVGFVVSTALYGFELSQARLAWHYCAKNTNDPPLVRAVVVLLVLMETAATALMGQILYHYLVSNYGNIFALAAVPGTFVGWSMLVSSTIVIVQLFFCYRTWRLSERDLKAIVVHGSLTACAVTSFVLTIILWVRTINRDSFVDTSAVGSEKAINSAAFVISIVADALITATLCSYLDASKTGLHQTDRVVSSLTAYVINRGLLIVACSSITFVTFLASPRILVTLAFQQQLSRSYCLTLFVILGSFEPFRLAARHPCAHNADHHSQSQGIVVDSASDFARNIQLEVRRDTDTYVLSTQAAANKERYAKKGGVYGASVPSVPDFLVVK